MNNTSRSNRPSKDYYAWSTGAVVAALLHYLAYRGYAKMTQTEVLGFVTGAACVWLTVRQNIWLWPISILNNIFFIVLFLRARLFADMTLQAIYIVLAILGWYWWLHGGPQRGRLVVSRIRHTEALAVAAVTVVTTVALVPLLRYLKDAAPMLDSLTTVLSLAAQYMLTRKLLENWLVWITADVIYIGLYFSRELYLTAALYALFICMCLAGLLQWRSSMQNDRTFELCSTPAA